MAHHPDITIAITSTGREITLPPNATTCSTRDLDVVQLLPHIGLLQQLRELTNWNNQLRSLPPEIAHLTKLRRLSIAHNQLQTLPPQIGHLRNLLSLNLAANQLRTLPPEIGLLEALRILHLASNQLRRLPLEIGKLQYLNQISLRDNPLEGGEPRNPGGLRMRWEVFRERLWVVWVAKSAGLPRGMWSSVAQFVAG